MIKHWTDGREVAEKNCRDCHIRVFWGGLAPRDQLIFTSYFNKDFEPDPKTVNYYTNSELTRIMLILLSVIFNQVAAWQGDPAIMQLCSVQCHTYLTAVNNVFSKRSDKKSRVRCFQMCKPYKMYDCIGKEKVAKKNLIISSNSTRKVPKLVWGWMLRNPCLSVWRLQYPWYVQLLWGGSSVKFTN